MAKPQTALILGDLHMPYHDVVLVEQAIAWARAHKPDFIVQIGDLYDQYSFTKYARDMNKETPEAEVDLAVLAASKMWASLQKASPKAKCFQLMGNHDMRVHKRVAEKLPELAGLLDYTNLYSFAGVAVTRSDRELVGITLNGKRIVFHHGYLGKAGDHCRYFGQNTVIGHSHRPHVVYDMTHDSPLWEFNVGYMGNPEAHVFKYGATEKLKWVRGFGVIDGHGPRFIAKW